MKNALISGASFAGLCTAYWLNQLGYQVTIVEINQNLKKGGTPVNILENTIEVVKQMGLFEQIKAQALPMIGMSFKNAQDETMGNMPREDQEEYEIERDVLLDMLYGLIKDDTKMMFGDSINALNSTADGVAVSFKNSEEKTFNLVFGCDGIHSVVRRLWFGHEAEYVKYLGVYFSISIVDELLIPDFTTQMYSEPGKTVMLNAYNGKTDICLCFRSENEIPYDYRNETQMRGIIQSAFESSGWRTPELLKKVEKAKTFYFDKLCQINMPSWTKGSVALVGDAGYCPSPAAGRGGSVAIDGAFALYEAMRKHQHIDDAFVAYNKEFRPFIEDIQSVVVDFGLDVLVPKTEEAIRERALNGFGF